MKRKPPDSRNALSALRLSLALSLATLVPLLLYGSAPSWWSSRGVLVEHAVADDYAPANQGQLKNIAKAAVAEMDAKLPGGAGEPLHQLVASWSTPSPQTNDFAPVNLGQLKSVAKPFYDRLISNALATEYPWTNPANAPDDFAAANIGQVKKLFSFELPAIDPLYDGDHNGLPDAWERQYFGRTGIDPNADSDADGISNLQEYRNHMDPTDFYNGALTEVAITGGGDQRGNPGALLPIPVSVRVRSLYNSGVYYAPVSVMIAQGGARLVADNAGLSVPSQSLTLRATGFDVDGYPVAQCYILLPPSPEVSIIRASVRGGSKSLSVATTAVAVDTALGVPANLNVTVTSASTAKLTWTATNALPTTLQVSIDDGKTWITLGTVAGGVTSATVSGLTPGRTTKFRVFSGGTPADNNNNTSFPLPDPSSSSPPQPGGGGASEPADAAPLAAPVLEVDQAEFVYLIGGGYRGMSNYPKIYKSKQIVFMNEFRDSDGNEASASTTQTFTFIPGHQSYGRGGREVTSTTTTGGGASLWIPYDTVISTDSFLKLVGIGLSFGSTSTETITLSDPYTDADAEEAGASASLEFYGEFYEPNKSWVYHAYFSHGGGQYGVQVAKYRFRVNADPNAVVTWDVQFTPWNGGTIQHDIHSWHGDGSTYSPVYELDPRFLNGGQNGSYKVILLNVDVAVDGNRDGIIGFTDQATRAADQTTNDQPYRFWVNDDDDTELAFNGEGGQTTGPKEADTVPVQAADFSKHQIGSKRNLEDFSRLWIDVSSLQDALTRTRGVNAPNIQIGLKWKNATGNPAINIYPSEDWQGSADYLTSENAAARQIGSDTFNNAITDKYGRNTISGIGTFIFKPEYWQDLSWSGPQKKCFLFEGAGEGTGELVIVFLDNQDKQIAEGASVFLDLKDIRKLYQHETLGGPDPWHGVAFEPAPEEEKQVIVFVHGWRLSPDDTVNFAETMFKRVWWRGFKGRFAAVRWDTYYNSTDHGWLPYGGEALDAYLAKYNDSEHNAWLTGQALANFVSIGLPSSYMKNIVAHSMGNIVVGAALEQGMIVDNYALLNAAIPAACYDENPDLQPASTTKSAATLPVHLWDPHTTPDDDPDVTTRALGYRSRLKAVGGILINFYLPDDYATSYAWELNNVLAKPPTDPHPPGNRPEFGLFNTNFGYDRAAPSGQKLVKYGFASVDHYLTDPNEAQPYACRTWAKAVGAEGRTRGPLSGTPVNLGTPAFGGDRGLDTEHSGQFNRSFQRLQTFYKELLIRLSIRQNP